MANTYTPDNWVIVQITSSKGTFYKFLGGFKGGFASGDSWKLSSQLMKVEDTPDGCFKFTTWNNSTYYGIKHAQHLTLVTQGVVNDLKKQCKMFGDGSYHVSVMDDASELLEDGLTSLTDEL